MKIHTKAVHSGDRKPAGGYTPSTNPIHTASSYFYDSMEQLDRVFARTDSVPAKDRATIEGLIGLASNVHCSQLDIGHET